MKVTLYKFHKAYFGDFSKGNIHYARAIGDTEERIYQAYSTGLEKPIINYHKEEYSRQLAIGFLNNYWDLATNYATEPLKDLYYTRNKFVIPKSLLTNRKRLDVTCNYCYDKTSKKIIFMEYGNLEVVEKWLPIFKAFAHSRFPLSPIPEIEAVICWDLSKGQSCEVNFTSLPEVRNDQLIYTARQIVLHS